MNPNMSACRSVTAVLCSILIAGGDSISFAQNASSASATATKIPNEQLDSLVAPIALYPDSLLGQVMVASTYPLEIVALSQWMDKNKNMNPTQITKEVEKQTWDPSVQAMAAFPDVVKNMAENIKWTDELGNAFLAQQNDVMDAVQRMRMKAKDSGQLQTTNQQKVETQVVENKTVVVIEPANPEVVYVPSYDPAAVWGAPAYYPYPPVYYPPGYAIAAGAISFGVGVAIGAAWGHGGWGWNCGWGGNNITINNNNAFINHYNNTRVNQGGNRYAGNGNRWQHNPEHRGGAPYGDRNTAQRFGGSARGDNSLNRQNAAKQNIGRTQSQGTASRLSGGNAAVGGGVGGGGNRGAAAGGGVGGGSRGPAAGGAVGGGRGPNPGGGVGAGARGPGAGSAIGTANRTSNGGMGGDRIGNQQTSRPSGGALGGSGMGGAGARQSSQRGRSSMGGFGGGGGGGMRGGGMRGGGGRRR